MNDIAKKAKAYKKASDSYMKAMDEYSGKQNLLDGIANDLLKQIEAFLLQNIGKTQWTFVFHNDEEFDLVSKMTLKEFFTADLLLAVQALAPDMINGVEVNDEAMELDFGLYIEGDHLCISPWPWTEFYELGGDIEQIRKALPKFDIDFAEHEKAWASVPPMDRLRSEIEELIEDGDTCNVMMRIDELIKLAIEEEKNGK